MKNDRVRKITSILLIFALITCCAISGTVAKYTDDITAYDTARVARFDVGGNTDATIDLFGTVLEADLLDEDDDVWYDEDIDDSVEKVIAPGTGGYFDIEMSNNSEVTVDYEMEFSVANTGGIPLEFSIDGGATWKSDIADLNDSGTLGNGDDQDMGTLCWRWVFTDDTDAAAIIARDTADTALGTADTLAQATVTVDVTFTQVD